MAPPESVQFRATSNVAAARRRMRMPAACVVGGTTRLSRPAQVALAIEIVFDYCRVRWHLWRADLPEVVARLRGTPIRCMPTTEMSRRASLSTGVRLGRAVVRTLGVLPTDSRCLMRSLVLTSVLARRGISTTLTIAARPAPTFAAHAWIERDGVALLAPGEEGYEPLTVL